MIIFVQWRLLYVPPFVFISGHMDRIAAIFNYMICHWEEKYFRRSVGGAQKYD